MKWTTILALLVFVRLLGAPALARADESPAPSEELPPPPPTPSPPEPELPKSPPARTGSPPSSWALRFDGGFGVRRAVGIPIYGGDVGASIGAQPNARVAIWLGPRLFLGNTENGLLVKDGRFTVDVDIIVDRLRFTPGLHLFVLGISRAVRDDVVDTWGGGLNGALRADVVQTGSLALFARAAIAAGIETAAGTLYWGPTLGIGVDFDVAGRRPMP